MTERIGVGVIGAGVISAQYLGNLTRAADVEVRMVADLDTARAAERAAEFGVASSGDVDELLARDDVEVVVNLTIPAAHVPVGLSALAAGKHVFSEKPLALDRAGGLQLLDAAATAGLRVACAPDTILGAGLQTARRLIESGAIGEPLTALTQFQVPGPESWHPNPEFLYAAGGGPVFDMGPYPINAVRNLFEAEPIEVYATGTKSPDSQLDGDFYHSVSVTLKFPQERLAQFTVSYVGDNVDTFTVFGSEGSLVLDPAYGMGKPKSLVIKQSGKTDTDTFKGTDQFGGELRYFSECILNGKDPEPDGEEGLLDVRVIEAIYKSLNTGSRIMLQEVQRSKHMDASQVQKLRPVSPPETVRVDSPAQ